MGFSISGVRKALSTDEGRDGYPGHLESHSNGGGVGGNEETRHPAPQQRRVPYPPATTHLLQQQPPLVAQH